MAFDGDFGSWRGKPLRQLMVPGDPPVGVVEEFVKSVLGEKAGLMLKFGPLELLDGGEPRMPVVVLVPDYDVGPHTINLPEHHVLYIVRVA